MTENTLATGADLDVCERDPLAFYGRIQDVGALLAAPTASHRLSHASNNLERWFDLPDGREDLDLQQLFFDDCDYFTYRRKSLSQSGHFIVANVLTNRGVEGDLLISSQGDHSLYEFEAKAEQSRPPPTGDPAAVSYNANVLPPEVAIEAILRDIHALTGYPKVMLYQFFPDGSGEVIAELNASGLDHYQGLRFPASDIPRIARSLYIDNPFRLIFNTQIPECEILEVPGALEPAPVARLDLSHSTLRSVAPVHLEYLHNMGVRSSASFPLLVMGKLWGLIALHAIKPTHISTDDRISVRKLIDRRLARQIMDARIQEEHKRFNASVQLLKLTAGYLNKLRQAGIDGTKQPGQTLPGELRTLIRCDGIVIKLEGRVAYCDPLVTVEEAMAIAGIGEAQALRGQFSSTSLTPFLDQDEDFRRRASGALYSTTGVAGTRSRLELLWLRSEQSLSVEWAGKPQKLVHQVNGEVRISPRQSFDVWREKTAGEALGWTSSDLLIASKLLIQILSHELRGAP